MSNATQLERCSFFLQEWLCHEPSDIGCDPSQRSPLCHSFSHQPPPDLHPRPLWQSCPIQTAARITLLGESQKWASTSHDIAEAQTMSSPTQNPETLERVQAPPLLDCQAGLLVPVVGLTDTTTLHGKSLWRALRLLDQAHPATRCKGVVEESLWDQEAAEQEAQAETEEAPEPIGTTEAVGMHHRVKVQRHQPCPPPHLHTRIL